MKPNKVPHTIPPSWGIHLKNSFHQAMSPFEEFVRGQSASGFLLMACTMLAMALANSTLSDAYESVLQTKITFGGGILSISYSLHHWINDGLMALFFFTVGLEIKREVLVGELADRRQAILPISAAIGGMLIPAIIYLSSTWGTDASAGWGIPMATDIAFALGILALLGDRIPRPLVAFLLALAIVDDLGAVLVIAVFYTEQINILALLFAGVALLLLIITNISGIRAPLPYIILGGLLWLGMLKSGIHATLAGVITALSIPANSQCTIQSFIKQIGHLKEQFLHIHKTTQPIMANGEQQKILQSMVNTIYCMESPLQRMEHQLHTWVSFLIIPLFALANAGIPIHLASLPQTLSHPVTLGIMAGLIGGKLIGIFCFSWLVIRLGWCQLPPGVTMTQIASVGLLAGIGFTMSLFITDLAFTDQAYRLNAKTGILMASLFAGITGYLGLRLSIKTRHSHS